VTVAIGVLIDTIIVRSVLVTALTLDVGRWIWWPSRLARPSPAEISPQEAAVVSGQLTAAR
jgi:RND superfamily putative drug exporter